MGKKDREIRIFIKEYVNELKEGKAAVFAGAGLSIPSGVFSWKDLLRSTARDIGIDVDKEPDLVTVAQYVYNSYNSRNQITKLIKKKISMEGEITSNHELISKLPINTIWTTNYDSYIEQSMRQVGKRIDVKRSVRDLSTETYNSEVTIFKMHGDLDQADDIVLLKDDYEIYDKKNGLFTQALKGDLITKTFLFIGFSFEDPNLESILSKVRIMLEGNPRTHYCIFKEVSEGDSDFGEIEDEKEKSAAIKYAKNRQFLKIKDLERYGIKALLVSEYEEITEILERIESSYKRNNIFISGSHADRENIEFGLKDSTPSEFVTNLASEISKRENKITSGFGVGIGSDVINGVLENCESKGLKLDDALILRPFPQNINDEKKRKETWTKYREGMLRECGIAIFVFGNKIDSKSNEIVLADGVEEEYKIALSLGIKIIPVGITGYQSKIIYEEIKPKLDEHYGINNITKEFDNMNNPEQKESDLILSILEIIEKIKEEY